MSFNYFDLPEGDRFAMGPLRINVPSLYDQIPIAKADSHKPGLVPDFQDVFHRIIYRRSQVPLYFRVKAKNVFRRTSIDEFWLRNFQSYWSKLGGRPLWHPSDFYFLRTFYRLRQPPPDANTNDTTSAHLDLWQNAGFLYGLFHAVLKETFSSEYGLLLLLRSLIPDWSTMLEYGSGSAPITSSIVQHTRLRRGCSCVICDLPTLTFHYAAHKFRYCSNVEPVLLRAEEDFQLITDRTFDVIFCCQVFEHLNRPLETAKRLVALLNVGGVLFFDYIKSEGIGLDSYQGLAERDAVLEYLSSSLRLEHGQIRKDKNVGLTVGRKI